MATLHISEAEAIRDFAGVLARVRAGQEVVIDAGETAVAVLSPAQRSTDRLLSESLRLSSPEPTMDPDFAADLDEIIRNRKPRSSAWD